MKVLHVLRKLDPGGIECWLDRLFRCWPDTDRPEFHFALESKSAGILAPGLIALGARIHHCPPPSDTRAMLSRFSRLLSEQGPFAAVHCHNHYAAAFHLSLARALEVPVRVTHSHADLRNRIQSRSRKLYRSGSRMLNSVLATTRLAVSKPAALDLFGSQSEKVRIFPCGINFQPLLEADSRPDASRFTLIHVGRLVPEKNHEFLLRLLKALLQREPRARLRLIGDGPLRAQLEDRTVQLGLSSQVEFWGNRTDIPELLSSSDCFVFPSHSEGLGLAAIEAQAVGLPVVMAHHLPAELDLFPGLCHRLALDLPISHWVDSLLGLDRSARVSSDQRQKVLHSSPFSIEANIKELRKIYAKPHC